MAWNEPGGNNNDPWKNKGGRDQGPPDLDEVFKNLMSKLGKFGAPPNRQIIGPGGLAYPWPYWQPWPIYTVILTFLL